MRQRTKTVRSMAFDTLEGRVVLSGGATGVQRNMAIVRDMGDFYAAYAAQVPPLVQKLQADQSSDYVDYQTYQNDYQNLYNTTTNLVNGLATHLYKDLGQNSVGTIRTLITGLPANLNAVSYAANAPASGSLLSAITELAPSDQANLTIIANYTIAEVYSLGYSGRQTFPNAPFATFYAQYSNDLGPQVDAYQMALGDGDQAEIDAAKLAIDNTTRSDVYALAGALQTQLGTNYTQAIDTLITGTPGPITPTSTATTAPNQLAPGAPGYGSLLATLNSLPYTYRNDPRLLSSVVQLFAYI